MAEYIERGAAINRLLSVAMTDDTFGMGIQFGVDHAIAVLNEAPTADVVEVVRCRDCVYVVKHWGKVLCAKRLYSDDYSVKVLTPTNLDNFCNYGAKMDGKVLPYKFIGKSQDGECGVEILDGKGDEE